MGLFLLRFSRLPEPASLVSMRYDPGARVNRFDGEPSHMVDGTQITKSREAADQTEVVGHAAAASFGTVMTATRESRDQVEERPLAESLMPALLGTTKTGTSEQSDPTDASHLGTLMTETGEARDQSEHARAFSDDGVAPLVSAPEHRHRSASPWPIRRISPRAP